MISLLNPNGMHRHICGAQIRDRRDTRAKSQLVARYIRAASARHNAAVAFHAVPETWLPEGVAPAPIKGRLWFCKARPDKGKGGVAASVDAQFARLHDVRVVQPPPPPSGVRPLYEALWLRFTVSTGRFAFVCVFHLAAADTLHDVETTQGDMLHRLSEQVQHFAARGEVCVAGDWNRERVPRGAGGVPLAESASNSLVPALMRATQMHFASADRPTRWDDGATRRLVARGATSPHSAGSRSIDHITCTHAFGAVQQQYTDYTPMVWTDHAAQEVVFDLPVAPLAHRRAPTASRRPAARRADNRKLGTPEVADAVRAATVMPALPPATLAAIGVRRAYQDWAAVITAAHAACVPTKLVGANRTQTGAGRPGMTPADARVQNRLRRQRKRSRADTERGDADAAARHAARALVLEAAAAEAIARSDEQKRQILLARLRLARSQKDIWQCAERLRGHTVEAPESAADCLAGDDGVPLPSDQAKADFATAKWAAVGADSHSCPTASAWRAELRGVAAEADAEMARPRRVPLNARLRRAEYDAALAEGRAYSAPGGDGVTYAFLRCMDATAHARLFAILDLIFETGVVPDEWGTASVHLLAKDGRDASKWSSYRAISLCSVVGKLWERMLLNRITPHAEKNNAIHRLQHGFRKKYSCTDAAILLAAATGMGRTPADSARFGKRYCAFADIRRAYPTVFRPAMLCRLRTHGHITGHVWRAVSALYETVQSTISVGAATAAPYDVANGEREGAVLSPALYQIFIDSMITAALEARAAVATTGETPPATAATHVLRVPPPTVAAVPRPPVKRIRFVATAPTAAAAPRRIRVCVRRVGRQAWEVVAHAAVDGREHTVAVAEGGAVVAVRFTAADPSGRATPFTLASATAEGPVAGSLIGSHARLEVGAIAFADDFVLCSDCPYGLQAMLDAVGRYAERHLFHFARDKTNVVVFGADKGDAPIQWTIPSLHKEVADEDDFIEQKSSYTYLGFRVHQDRQFHHHHNWLAAKYDAATAQALRDRGTGAFGCGGPAAAMMYAAVAAGAIDRGSIVTAASDANKKSRTDDLGKLHASLASAAADEIGGCRTGARDPLLREAGMPPLEDRRRAVCAREHARIMSLPSDRAARQLVAAAAADHTIMGARWNASVSRACAAGGDRFGHPTPPLTPASKAVRRATLAVHAIQRQAKAATDDPKPSAALSDLVHARRVSIHGTICLDVGSASYNAVGYSAWRQFSAGCAPLNCLLHHGPDRSAACPCCDAVREDAVHVLTACPAYAAVRTRFLAEVAWPVGALTEADAVAWLALDTSTVPQTPLPALRGAVFRFCAAIARARFPMAAQPPPQ